MSSMSSLNWIVSEVSTQHCGCHQHTLRTTSDGGKTFSFCVQQGNYQDWFAIVSLIKMSSGIPPSQHPCKTKLGAWHLLTNHVLMSISTLSSNDCGCRYIILRKHYEHKSYFSWEILCNFSVLCKKKSKTSSSINFWY